MYSQARMAFTSSDESSDKSSDESGDKSSDASSSDDYCKAVIKNLQSCIQVIVQLTSNKDIQLHLILQIIYKSFLNECSKTLSSDNS